MVITVTCPSCAASFPVDSKKIPAAGVSARCSSCRYVFRIERPVEPPPAPPEPVWAPPPPVHAPPPRAPEPEPAPESTWAPPPPPPPPAPEPEPAWAPPPPEPEPYVEPEPAPDFGITSFEEPAAHEEPAHAETDFSVGATAQERAPAEREWVFEKEEQIDPGSLNIQPLEAAEPAPFAPAPFQAAPPPPPAPEPPAPAHAEPAVGSFTFGKRDPKDKARRLARVLVSDMIMYNPQRHERALANGSLREDFEDEIAKSWKEYVDQVGEEMATQNPFWADALNDVLAKGQKIF